MAYKESPSVVSGLTNMAVAIVLAVVILGTVMVPVINTVTEPMQIPHTLTNYGTPFQYIDGDNHTIEITLDGDEYVISTDGTQMDILERTPDDEKSNPFNVYYAAINLAGGDNADDSGETRLSKEKGAVAYILDPNNLRQTKDGYTFDKTLYNVMLIIPPVYWYSDGTDKLYIASSPTAFSGLTLKDYAHTYTSGGQTGHTDAIAIGVYEAYNLNGVMVSQADRTPTVDTSLTSFVGLANAGNTDNSNSTYRVWNYFDWTLYKIMCWTIMGNTDSQYMMGAGPTSMSASSVTGLTTSAIQKSANAQPSVSLLLENTWGSVNEWLGDTVNNAGTLVAGNTLVQPTAAANVVNVLEETVTMPTSSGYYGTVNTSSDVFGTMATTGSSHSAGQGINDYFYGSSFSSLALLVGGYWNNGGYAGVSFCRASHNWNYTNTDVGSRLACTVGAGAAPVVYDSDYAYIITYNNSNGVTISNVQSVDNGITTSRMPTGTTLNGYWDMGVSTPAEINDGTGRVTYRQISIGGDNAILMYSNGYARMYNINGYEETARVTSSDSVLFTVTDSTLAYGTDWTVGTEYFVGGGDYVYAHYDIENPIYLTDDTEIRSADYVRSVTSHIYQIAEIGYLGSGTVRDYSVTVLDPQSSMTLESTVATVQVTEETGYVTNPTITFRSDWGSDTSETTIQSVLVPKEVTWYEEGEGIGMAGTILGIVPIFVVLGIILGVAAYMSPGLRNRF